jgi:hypothetical protein
MRLPEAATLDRKSGEADLSRLPRLAVGRAVEGSAVPRTYWKRGILYSNRICHLDRSVPGISCHPALDMATCAAFVKESRMKIANATTLKLAAISTAADQQN